MEIKNKFNAIKNDFIIEEGTLNLNEDLFELADEITNVSPDPIIEFQKQIEFELEKNDIKILIKNPNTLTIHKKEKEI